MCVAKQMLTLASKGTDLMSAYFGHYRVYPEKNRMSPPNSISFRDPTLVQQWRNDTSFKLSDVNKLSSKVLLALMRMDLSATFLKDVKDLIDCRNVEGER